MMNHSKVMHLSLVLIVACAGGLSCKSVGSQTTTEKARPQEGKKVLSAKELIDIAIAAGPQYDRDPGHWEVVVDTGNARWREFVVWRFWVGRSNGTYDINQKLLPEVSDDEVKTAAEKHWPMLKGHDYQVLQYTWRGPPIGLVDAGRAVLIDRNTGEILVVVGAFGEALSPRRVPSNQEMIDIATKAGVKYGRDPKAWKVVMDDRNASFKTFAFRRLRPPSYDELEATIVKRWPMLKDHNYQALWYDERPPTPKPNVIPYSGLDTQTVVLIDRNTGETLVVLGAFGQVVRPREVLSNHELLGIAAAAGRQYRSDPEMWATLLDVGNASWKAFALRRLFQRSYDEDGREIMPNVTDDELQTAILTRWPVLKGHDYQAFGYRWVGSPMARDTTTTVLLDRHTGTVLAVVDAHGRVLGPNTR